ncbi:purine-binding chemotaxis protein CheW [Verrucomicrobium sp. GAS474]|uniref:chemotaxis protein CheW n=1 Tax=Verrucomicrobium sp. GAS474 TaxID=1882831 RepID=UPI00087B994D|nr:chemotaxis protein CheW [Verrucomicrobium sp. GAS474]SDT85954.1 purine-binding chemotaxis protein CheW [Verrucomicrobium sp. GAS474]
MKLFGNRQNENSFGSAPSSSLAGKYLVFELAGEFYGILLQKIQEIALVENIITVGPMPSYALGILEVRGNFLPVIDLRRRLNVREKKNDHRSSVLIAHITPPDGRTLAAGFLIDGIDDVLILPHETILETPYTLRNGLPGEFAGISRIGEGREKKTITLINVNALLTRKDINTLLS